MRRLVLGLMLCVLCGSLLAQQSPQRGKIKKVDLEKGLVAITTAEGKDVECTLTPQSIIHDTNNQDLAGFRQNGLPSGTNIVFRSEQRGDKLVLVGMKLQGQAAGQQNAQ